MITYIYDIEVYAYDWFVGFKPEWTIEYSQEIF